MDKNITLFKNDQRISSPLAMVFLVIFSVAVAQYFLSLARDVIASAEDSPSFNVEIRAKENNLR